jgi:hypothetical protein
MAQLFNLNMQSALLLPMSQSNKTGLDSATEHLLRSAEKLGGWCADLTLLEISKLLKVRF